MRDAEGKVLLEGVHLIVEAFQNQIEIEQLFVVREDLIHEDIIHKAQEVYEINLDIAEALSDTVTPQGVFAVIQKPTYEVADKNRVLLVDRVQDPGNLGTMIRTADAAGYDLIVISRGTVDPYQDKVLRASQGSVFHIPIVNEDLLTFIQDFDGPVYGTALEDAVPYKDVEISERFCLILGNEGEGVSKDLLKETTQNLTVPIYGRAESLNVSIAAGILMYHLRG